MIDMFIAHACALPHPEAKLPDTPLAGFTIAFDLDGTLVDTAPDLIATANMIMGEQGFAASDPALLRPMISLGAKAMLRHAHELQGLEAEEDDLDILLERFLEYYAENCTNHSRPFPGAEDALQQLQDMGAQLTVCTNKTRGLSKLVLDGLKLSPFFTGLYCADDVAKKKPAPEHVLEALSATGKGLMVGDSETDFLAARRADVPVILLEHGYSELPVRDLPANAHLPGFAGLPEKITELLA